VPRSKKQSRAIPLLTLRAFVAYKKRVKPNYTHAAWRLVSLLLSLISLPKEEQNMPEVTKQ
jgi:hypothetical protein